MLPVLPSPQLNPAGALSPANTPPSWGLRLRVVALGALLLLLSLGLGACGRLPMPPQAVVQRALSLQIELTQQAIASALELPPPGAASVRHVRIEAQRGITIGDGRGLQLSGHFDWRLGDEPTLLESPFELYLQRGERGQSWRLARPTGGDPESNHQQWLIDPLPIPG